MTVQAVPMVKRIDWRANIFRLVALLVALFFMAISAPYIGWPWNFMPIPLEEIAEPELMRWHSATWATYATIFTAIPLLMLLKGPREKALLMQYWLLGQIIVLVIWTLASNAPFAPDQLIIILLVAAAYPAPKELLALRPNGSLNRSLLALSGLVTLALVPVFLNNYRLHLNEVGSQIQESGQYMHALYLTILIPLASLLASTNRTGWRDLVMLAGISLLYLGASSLSVPDHTGSYGIAGGAAALLAGAIYLFLSRNQN